MGTGTGSPWLPEGYPGQSLLGLAREGGERERKEEEEEEEEGRSKSEQVTAG
jgi:hypothetical protein